MATQKVNYRVQPSTVIGHIVTILALVLWSLAIYYAYTQALPRKEYAIALATIAFTIYILKEAVDVIEERNYLDLYLLSICLLIILITGTYLLLNFEALLSIRVGIGYHHEYMLSILFIISIMYLVHRAFGSAFLLVFIGGTLYAWLGAQLPGILGHGGLSMTRILNIYILNLDGFFGSITGIVAAWVALFLLYAGLLNGYGAFDYVMRIAFRLSTYIRSGIAQSAVIASLIIGSINGAQTANAAMTGSVTIPMMKKSGMKASTAAGIEAVASSGGQIMPPVMGAGAFIMASLLGITYVEVILAGVVPAFVFYTSVAVAVHYSAINQEIKTNLDIEEMVEETRSRPEFILETIKLGIPFLVLVVTLGILQWTIMSAALYTTVTMFVTGVIFPLIERAIGWGDASIRDVVNATIQGAEYGAITFAPIVLIVAAINAIVDVFVSTGVPGKLALALLELSGGILLFALLLAMLICIILGLGMPTVAAYTIVALLVAPTLIEQFALQELSAHYFVFYAAILSGITPPIAISVVVTTGIAGSNFWETALEAIKIGSPLFVLPFSFAYNPEVIVGELTVYKFLSSVLLVFGAAAIVHGLNYYGETFNNRLSNWSLRITFIVLGIIIMVHPDDILRGGVFAVTTILFAWQLMEANGTSTLNILTSIRRRI